MDAEFQRLTTAYTPEGAMDTVDGALGPLFCVVVEVAGVPVKGLVDPGSSATIMSFELFKEVRAKAAIPRKALKKSDVTLDYSQRPIPIFAQVSLEFHTGGRRVRVPVYLRSNQGPVSEPCLLGTSVVLPL